MFSDGMGNNLAKHVKELSKRFLPKEAIGAIAPLKTNESNLFIMNLYNSENIIMAHPVVVDDELGASPYFLRS